jgi:hypothetical protein
MDNAGLALGGPAIIACIHLCVDEDASQTRKEENIGIE